MKSANFSTTALKKIMLTSCWYVLAIFGAILASSMLIMVIGKDPVMAFCALLKGALGNLYAVSETLVRATPLIFTGLAVSVAYKARLVNLGAEGQFYAGAIASAGIGVHVSSFSIWLAMPLMVLGAFLAGGLYAMIPGLMKARFKVNEVIAGLMLNFIIIQLVTYLVEGPWRQGGLSVPRTPMLTGAAQLPRILGVPHRIHYLFVVAVLLSVALFLVYKWTLFGFKLKLLGSGDKFAAYAGINVGFYQVLVMVISGGIAGLAGLGEVAGVHRYLMAGISPGYGYYGFVIALLVNSNPLGIIISSIFFAILLGGAESMQRVVGVPINLIVIIQGLVLFFVIATDSYRARREKRRWMKS